MRRHKLKGDLLVGSRYCQVRNSTIPDLSLVMNFNNWPQTKIDFLAFFFSELEKHVKCRMAV